VRQLPFGDCCGHKVYRDAPISLAAMKHFGQLVRESELPAPAEQNLYHRIASSLVSGGDDEDVDEDAEGYDEEAAITESIAALDEDLAVMIARDMLRLYELVADPPDLDSEWPPEWPPA
jgi:hypothetical protein